MAFPCIDKGILYTIELAKQETKLVYVISRDNSEFARSGYDYSEQNSTTTIDGYV